jgi:hypothetical protein
MTSSQYVFLMEGLIRENSIVNKKEELKNKKTNNYL